MMRLFQANIYSIVLRYYLLMATVILGLFTGQIWMVFLALPIFLSCLLGLKVNTKTLTEQGSSIKHLVTDHLPLMHRKDAA